MYSRVMMHEYLSKERDLKGINFVTPTFFTDHRINWLGGKTAVRLDASAKKVLCADGTEVPYDRLLLATGAKYCIPPIQGLRDAGRVFGFRDYADAAQLDVLANAGKRCAVIGAGLVGMDVAYAMSK
ncbi:MAG: FAD-dependent oxidoreductase, partial [Oscillospiraceae bacterium]